MPNKLNAFQQQPKKMKEGTVERTYRGRCGLCVPGTHCTPFGAANTSCPLPVRPLSPPSLCGRRRPPLCLCLCFGLCTLGHSATKSDRWRLGNGREQVHILHDTAHTHALTHICNARRVSFDVLLLFVCLKLKELECIQDTEKKVGGNKYKTAQN